MNFCWIVPHYNHADEFCTLLLSRLVKSDLPCIVIDDGSDPRNLEKLTSAIEGHKSISVVLHPVNQGKGAAVLTGCHHAREKGFTHVIQIDADGQHEPDDAQRFITASRANPGAFISGYPIFDETVPKVRKYGRRITTFWVMLETASLKIKDALCGYRVYPLDVLDRLNDRFKLGNRMDFDTEILVKALWDDVPVHFIDTRVTYIDGGTSHFHYLRDNLILIKLHALLVLQSVLHLPRSVLRRFRR